MIDTMTPEETLYFQIRKAKGLIKPLKESPMSKILKEINQKLPLVDN